MSNLRVERRKTERNLVKKQIKTNSADQYSKGTKFDADTEDHLQKFKEWAKDKSRIEKFKSYKLVGNYVIVEVFRVGVEEKIFRYNYKENNRDKHEDINFNQYIYPFAKILAVPPDISEESDFYGIKPGDIYVLNDDVRNFAYTTEYLNSVVSEESNSKLVNASNINSLELNLTSLMDKKIFLSDKFSKNLSPDELFTFRQFLTADFLLAKYIDNED